MISNNYVQEILCSLIIESHHDIDDNVTYQYAIFKDEVKNPMLVASDYIYSLPQTILDLKEYEAKKEEMFKTYEPFAEQSDAKLLREEIKEHFKDQFEKMTQFPKNLLKDVDALMEEEYIAYFKRIREGAWEVAVECIKSVNEYEKIIYFVMLEIDKEKHIIRKNDVKIYTNSLPVRGWRKMILERKLKKLK